MSARLEVLNYLKLIDTVIVFYLNQVNFLNFGYTKFIAHNISLIFIH